VVLCKYDTLVILHISDKCRSIFLFLCKMWIKCLQDVFYYLFRFHFSLLEIIHGLCMGSSTHISYFYKFCLSQKCFPTKCIQPPPMNPSTKFQSKDRNKIEFSYFVLRLLLEPFLRNKTNQLQFDENMKKWNMIFPDDDDFNKIKVTCLQ
jgi:hypothetical protein